MTEIHFTNLLIVVAAAFAAPFLLGLAPRVRLPSVVLEIVAGIVIGPAVLGWVEIDDPIEVLNLIGLAFLLFLAGLESTSAACAAPCFDSPRSPTSSPSGSRSSSASA